ARRDFAAILADLMAELPLRSRRVRGGAVRLLHLADLAARSFDHVIVLDLLEGVAPARGAATDGAGLYGDPEGRAPDGARRRRALATSVNDERTPFETLMLVGAVAAARKSVLLAYPRTVDDRPVARSPFVDELLRAAPRTPIARAPLTPLPPLGASPSPSDAL